ncbi:MAG: virulence factor family protein [Nevskiaceae bacterium]|nr:MAG: virulence factor family protein [Nevskiaceae bacterium]TAM32763.1 MAG: virulence factor family protein [Nevskiaceae bacterium]
MSLDRRHVLCGALLTVVLALLAPGLLAAAPAKPAVAKPVLAANEQVLDHGRFRQVHVFSPSGNPKSFALLLSGDGGWQPAMSQLAQTLVAEGALVAGIDSAQFMADLEADGGDCVFPDGDLENLSHFVQAYAKAPGYRPPVLVGYSAGATLGYATLAQAPAETFAAGLLLGFCPDLELKKAVCPGEGLRFERRKDGKGVDFLPAPKLAVPLLNLLGSADPVCDAPATGRFLAQIPAARQVLLAGVGHDYAASPRARAAFVAAYHRLATRQGSVAAAPTDLGDLPVIEEPAASGKDNPRFAVLWSGDGGWAGLDKEVSAALQAQGISVVGVDSLRYFWTSRTPAGIAADVDKIIRHYLSAWNKREVILIGYSQGADVLPFAVNGLPAETRAKVLLAAGMGLSDHAVFEFQLSNWVADNNNGPETLPEVRRMRGVRFLCIYGAEEDDSICPQLQGSNALVAKLPGGHHFDGDYDKLAATILGALPAPLP